QTCALPIYTSVWSASAGVLPRKSSPTAARASTRGRYPMRETAAPARTAKTNPDRRPSRHTEDSYDNIEPRFAELAALPAGDPRRDALREQIIGLCLPLADHIARRFTGRGEAYDDLHQTARLGLVQAVDRFDVARGSSFLAFAVPTIMGEVRRHFRDHT